MKKRLIFSVDVDYFPGSETGVLRIIDMLKDRNIKGTFFITGKFAEDYPYILKEIVKNGHELGCHGYSHGIDQSENFVNINTDEQFKKIKLSTDIIQKIACCDVKVFRAPFLRANENTITVLESLGYLYDSSVSSLRFDFGLGMANNYRTLFAPTNPYHPSRKNIFKKGSSRILEVPASGFGLPLSMTGLRMFGLKTVNVVYKFSSLLFNPMVFIIHPWEVMDIDGLYMWDTIPERHRKNRGKAALTLLQDFIDSIGDVVYLRFNDVLTW